MRSWLYGNLTQQVEFDGRTLVQAAIVASYVRLRPILMTSFAFMLGGVPLVIWRWACAAMRQAMGIAVLSGMIGVATLGTS